MNHFDPAHYSKRYKRALSIAIMLFLATLTITILLAILSRASRRDLEEDYQSTFTAIVESAAQNAALAYGNYPFRPRVFGDTFTDIITYSAAASCDTQTLTALILDQVGQALDTIIVLGWGDDVIDRQRAVNGGEPGQWSITFPGVLNRHIWIQLATGEDGGPFRYLSPPIEIVFEQDNCTRNQAELIFDQVASLE